MFDDLLLPDVYQHAASLYKILILQITAESWSFLELVYKLLVVIYILDP